MSKRSGRVTLQPRNENTAVQTVKTTRKRKSECSKRKSQAATKKQSYEIQNCWSEGGASPCILIETPYNEVETPGDLSGFKQFRFKNLFVKPSPLPLVSWASSDDVWINMLNKELKYVHDKGFIVQHPRLQSKMRSILLDWLLEVSEVYMLQRQTFYLAQDFFDRFMLTQNDLEKTRLQLIGITSLFIASKIEEIYPPKLLEFAYVTDGACDEEEILEMELIIMKALNWDLSPETVISWLKLYVQVASLKDNDNLLIPQFSQQTFVQITRLLDVCILDINSLNYQYGVLAAAAFCHFTSFDLVQKVSGLTQDILQDCMNWMGPFMTVVCEHTDIQVKDFKQVAPEDRHNIQTHMDYLTMLKHAQEIFLARLSPPPFGILTPPKSTEKTVTH